MTDPAYPIGKIDEQPLTITAIMPDSTLVDDTVALVDDARALVGSQVTLIQDSRTHTIILTPKGRIEPRR